MKKIKYARILKKKMFESETFYDKMKLRIECEEIS